MATATEDMDAEHEASLGRRYLIRFEEDTLRPRPLWIRLIIEFVGTFVLVTVAAGSGVINHYVGGGPTTPSPTSRSPTPTRTNATTSSCARPSPTRPSRRPSSSDSTPGRR